MRRKLALVSATVALGALLVVGGTMAYFTGTDNKTNTITTYGNGIGLDGDIKVLENLKIVAGQKTDTEGYYSFEGGYKAKEQVVDEELKGIDYKDLKPGITIQKNPSIKYDGTTPAYVRYKVAVMATFQGAADAVEVPLENVTFYKDGTPVKPMDAAEGKILGVVGDDNYVYYTSTWTSETPQDLLFDSVKFNGNSFGNDFIGATITIDADAVSAEDFALVKLDDATADHWGGLDITTGIVPAE